MRYVKKQPGQKPKLPADIPANPQNTYADHGWHGWGDWLGTGNLHPREKKFQSFKAARLFVRSLNLRSMTAWRKFCSRNRPEDIPSHPEATYRTKGWKSYADWLGVSQSELLRPRYRPFRDARRFARSLGLTSLSQWLLFCLGKMPDKGQRPRDVPANPQIVYRQKGWKSAGDWLGTGTIATRARKYRDFAEARQFARSLSLKSGAEWLQFCRGLMPEKGALPPDIPINAYQTYESKGWRGFDDWLGTGRKAPGPRRYIEFQDARSKVRRYGLKNQADWVSVCRGTHPKGRKLPADIPAAPWTVYKRSGWINLGDWLGTGNVATSGRIYLSYPKARAFVVKLGLTSNREWRAYCAGQIPRLKKKPSLISANPDRTYARLGWVNWQHWLGTDRKGIANRER
jgi:hypothetical protein